MPRTSFRLQSRISTQHCCLRLLGQPRPTRPCAFRSRTARPTHSLSTLRDRPYGTTAQDSLPAGGTTLAGRGFHPVDHLQGFSLLPPRPGLAWRTPMCNGTDRHGLASHGRGYAATMASPRRLLIAALDSYRADSCQTCTNCIRCLPASVGSTPICWIFRPAARTRLPSAVTKYL